MDVSCVSVHQTILCGRARNVIAPPYARTGMTSSSLIINAALDLLDVGKDIADELD